MYILSVNRDRLLPRISHSCIDTYVDIPCTNNRGWVIILYLSQVSSNGPKDILGITLLSAYTLYYPVYTWCKPRQAKLSNGVKIPDVVDWAQWLSSELWAQFWAHWAQFSRKTELSSELSSQESTLEKGYCKTVTGKLYWQWITDLARTCIVKQKMLWCFTNLRGFVLNTSNA